MVPIELRQDLCFRRFLDHYPNSLLRVAGGVEGDSCLLIFGDIVPFHVRLKTWTAAGQLARLLGSNTAFGTGKITRRKGPCHVFTLLSEMVASLQGDPWTTLSGSGHWRASRLESASGGMVVLVESKDAHGAERQSPIRNADPADAPV